MRADQLPVRSASLTDAALVLSTVSTLLDTIDWDELVAVQNRAETLGPILLPTEYAQSLAGGTSRSNMRLLRATATYLAELRALADEAKRG